MTDTEITKETANDIDLLQDLLARARKAGADAADAVLVEGVSLSHARRLGKTEKLERSEGQDLGLRVLIGKRQAMVSSSDRAPKMLAELVERTLAMAKAVPEDPFCGLADPDGDRPRLAQARHARSRRAERRDLDRARPRRRGGRAGGQGDHQFRGGRGRLGPLAHRARASNGFAGGYAGSSHGVSASVIGGSGTQMERDYDFASAVYAADLRDPAEIGRSAGERAVKRLGARKMATGRVPVVFDPRVARSFISHLLGAISGPSIARGTSFLKDKLGQRIFPEAITLDRRPAPPARPPLEAVRRRRHRQPAPRADRQGRADDLASRFALGAPARLQSTGHAARGTASPPSPAATNVWIEPGAISPAELIADIKSGLYVTELMGMGVNGLTGDYSRGAAGFWIENGEIAFPVSEMTVAGNLNDMFLRLVAADDLEFRTGADAPTLRIDDLTVAGA